jgi:hypothetical protein
MKAPIVFVATALTSILVLACANPDTQPKLTWLRADGSPATRAELEAAKQQCMASTASNQDPAHPKSQFHAYGSAIVQCVEGKGYKLVDEDQP